MSKSVSQANEAAVENLSFLSQTPTLGGLYVQYFDEQSREIAGSAQTLANISNVTPAGLQQPGGIAGAVLPANCVWMWVTVLTADLYYGFGASAGEQAPIATPGAGVALHVPSEPMRVGERWQFGRYPR